MRDSRVEKLAEVLVGYSTGVKAGDVVSLSGPPLAESLIVALYRQVLRAGGHPIVLMAPEECAEELYRQGSPEQLRFVSPLERLETEGVDVAVHVLAASNTQALATVDPARQAVRNQARRELMQLFLDRAARGALRWVVTQFPCPASAQDAEMSLTEYEDFVFAAGLLEHPDPAA